MNWRTMTPADWDRLHATQRAEEIAAEARVPAVIVATLCAWCQAELPEDQRDRRENVSHGICERHLKGLQREVRERKTAPPRVPCPRCQHMTHPDELIATETRYICARCVEEIQMRTLAP